MRRLLLIFAPAIALASALTPRVSAQVKPEAPAVHVQDGGTRETLESIFIPPMAHAPFSLVLATEWTRPLSNGGTYTLVNQRHIMRDSRGRIYEERWLLVPRGGKLESRMNFIQVADPVTHTLYNCQVESKTCFLLRYSGSTNTVYTPNVAASGPLGDGNGFRTREELGSSSSNGVDTVGLRETITINPGVYGNDQPMVTTREFWFAPALGINLISKLDSPQSGKQAFTVKELSTSEPDPSVFELPTGYKVVDRRKDSPPQN